MGEKSGLLPPESVFCQYHAFLMAQYSENPSGAKALVASWPFWLIGFATQKSQDHKHLKVSACHQYFLTSALACSCHEAHQKDTAVKRLHSWFSEIDDGMVRWWVKRGARALRGLRERLWERYTVSPRSTFEFYDDSGSVTLRQAGHLVFPVRRRRGGRAKTPRLLRGGRFKYLRSIARKATDVWMARWRRIRGARALRGLGERLWESFRVMIHDWLVYEVGRWTHIIVVPNAWSGSLIAPRSTLRSTPSDKPHINPTTINKPPNPQKLNSIPTKRSHSTPHHKHHQNLTIKNFNE